MSNRLFFHPTLSQLQLTNDLKNNVIFQDDYSHYGIQAFSKQLQQEGGCLAFQLTMPKSPTAAEIQEMADRLQSSSAQVVVVFATEGQLLDLFLEVRALKRTICMSQDILCDKKW